MKANLEWRLNKVALDHKRRTRLFSHHPSLVSAQASAEPLFLADLLWARLVGAPRTPAVVLEREEFAVPQAPARPPERAQDESPAAAGRVAVVFRVVLFPAYEYTALLGPVL